MADKKERTSTLRTYPTSGVYWRPVDFEGADEDDLKEDKGQIGEL